MKASVGITLILCAFCVQHLNAAEENAGVIKECRQPEPALWEKIKLGMSEKEVRELLGNPLSETQIPEEFKSDPTYVRFLVYGRLSYNTPVMPCVFEHYITLKNGTVSAKKDPFNGASSLDGKPGRPTLNSPQNKAVFDFYPRLVDLRWQPVPGQNPIHYEIEIQSVNGINPQGPNMSKTFTAEYPHLATAFVSVGLGRWRVRSKNVLAASEWTEWSYFEFTK